MISNSSHPISVKDSVDGLPKQFISSLRILFDILDENRSGFVRLRDIESRWSDDGVRGLPQGVVDGLRKVTPPNGLLTFDRFVAGLKLVLTRRRDEHEFRRPFASKENRSPLHDYNAGDRNYSRDVTSQKFPNEGRYSGKSQNIGSREFDNIQFRNQRQAYPSQPNLSKSIDRHSNESPYGILEGQRKSPSHIPKSGSMSHRDMPHSAYAIKPEVSHYPNKGGSHLGPPGASGNFHRTTSSSNQMPRQQEKDRPPTVPPRNDRPPRGNSYSPQMKKSTSGPELGSHSHSPPAIPPREQQSSRILNDLKNWQREWQGNQNSDSYGRPSNSQSFRNTNQDNAIYANIEQFQRRSEDPQQPKISQQQQPQSQQLPTGQQAGPQKATVRRHGSGRRHTLANGIDQNMLKRMKQLEEEAAMLRSGLAMLDSARDWYMKQLAAVSDKQAMLGKVTYNDNSVEAYQERITFQKARIGEINQHLKTLLESSEKGFPLHMNLAMSAGVKPGFVADDTTVRNLKEQNRRLMEEIGQRKDQITVLEKEKSSLVRELFEVRSKNKSNFDDTTFM